MSKKFGLMGLESKENQYLNGRTVLNCSDVTAADIDREVMAILKESYEEAKRLLSENRDALDKIAAFLIEKETITGKEFMKIFREVKGIPEPAKQFGKDGKLGKNGKLGRIKKIPPKRMRNNRLRKRKLYPGRDRRMRGKAIRNPKRMPAGRSRGNEW